MPIISPNATTSAKLMLLFDGAQPNDEHTLASVGVCALETMHFTALIQDPELMAKKEMEDSYRYALERSRQEAAEARKAMREKRERLVAQRVQQVEAEKLAADQKRPEGPALMLTAGPGPPAAICDAGLGTAVTGENKQPQSGLLMLTARAANTTPEAATAGKPEQTSTGSPPVDGNNAAPPAPRDWGAAAFAIAAAYASFFEH